MTMILTIFLIVGIFASITSLHLRLSMLEEKFDIFMDLTIEDNNKTKNVFAGRIARDKREIELLAEKQGYTFVEDPQENEND